MNLQQLEDMTRFAKMLNGRQYRSELCKQEEYEAAELGIVIVFGGGDDLMEFRGAIHEELGAYEGTTAYLTRDGLLENDCDDNQCPHFKRLCEKAQTIKAIWDDYGPWRYETSIQHKTFDVMEDGEIYCHGIVFVLSHVGV